VYARLGAPRTSRAAIAFSAAATTARFAEKVLLRAANEREGFSRRDGRSNARTNETHDDGDESSSFLLLLPVRTRFRTRSNREDREDFRS